MEPRGLARLRLLRQNDPVPQHQPRRPGINLLLTLAAVGLPLVGGVNEILARSRSQVFFKKSAQQAAPLGLVLLAYTLLVGGSATYMVMVRSGGGELAALFALPTLLSLGLWLLFSAIYGLSAKSMKNAPQIHAALGILGGIGGLFGVHAVAALVRASLAPLHATGASASGLSLKTLLLPQASAPFWPLLAHFILLVPAAAGGVGLIWLILRRERDDWGRDYYAFAMRLAARWTALPLLCALGVQSWLVLSLQYLPPALLTRIEIAGPFVAGQILGLVAAWLLLRLSRSETPMRDKPQAFAALVCLWGMAAGTVFSVLKFMLL